MQLYRAVSPAELADLQRDGQFRACPHSCEGKHFAFSLADARKWGRALHGSDVFRVVAVVVADELGAQFFRWNHLDGIGPACFATIQQLKTAQLVEVLNDD